MAIPTWSSNWDGPSELSQLNQEGWALVVLQQLVIERWLPHEAKGNAWVEPLTANTPSTE